MNDHTFLSVFTPSRTAPEDLESIFVQRQEILADAVERIHESATTPNKHHLLFVGPRGTGKTHLITLLVHRLGNDLELRDRLHIAWLNEDETSTTLLEFLRRIYLALVKRYPESYSEASLEPIYDLDPITAESQLGRLLREQLKDRTLLVAVENLDALFQGLGESGQQRLRAFIQEHPILSIVATAQRLVDDIAKRKSMFFGFFQTEPLDTLTVEEAAELLGKIAALKQQPDLAAFLRSPRGRSRIRALHHLSGGNHRIYIVLSQFITSDSIDALVGPFSRMIDEMTPYYQERIRWLPPLQRKIIEYLCTRERPTPVKELARRLFASPQSISGQLKDLRANGYVQAAQRGRESLYEIAEPLMRICIEVKENQSRAPLRLLVDFLRVWYDTDDLAARLQGCDHGGLDRRYLEAALEKNAQHGNLRAQLLVEDFRASMGEDQGALWLPVIQRVALASEELAVAFGELAKGNLGEALSLLTDIIEDRAGQSSSVKASARFLGAEIRREQGLLEQAIGMLDQLLEMPDVPTELVVKALVKRGAIYGLLRKPEQAIANYSTVLTLPQALPEQVAGALLGRGIAYGQLGRSDEEIADYTAVINLPQAPTDQVATAFLRRGAIYDQLGKAQEAFADYSAVIDLPQAPTETLTWALIVRGLIYDQLGKSRKAIADYTTVITLPHAPNEAAATALLARGIAHGELGKTEEAIRDYTAAIALSKTPTKQVAWALVNRGLVYWKLRDALHAEEDLKAALALTAMPSRRRVDVQITLTEIRIASGRWNAAIATLTEGLTDGASGSSRYFGNADGIVAALFASTLTPGIRRERVGELTRIYSEHNALAHLGQALIEHVGSLYCSAEGLPASDNLELWAQCWQEAGRDMDAFRIPLRIFRTGIDFLKSGGKDRGTLLDLNQEERGILEQALGLETAKV
ncbi:ArsR family transcriptional regulator [Methylolobus aquaticus]|nr:ArsR family transcriptional regulator [Methylolobus aquaticus]